MTDPRLLVSLAGLLASRVANCPDQVVIRSDQGCLTYREIEERSRLIAENLLTAGVHRGDSVATMVQRTDHAVAVWFACARAGFVEVPLNVELKDELLVDAVQGANCSIIVVGDDPVATQQLDAVEKRLPRISRIEGLQAPSGAGGGIDWPLKPDEVSLILYTSGTTGRSKGVRLSDRMTMRLAWSVIDHVGLTAEDVLFTVFPLHHIAARFVSVVAAMLIEGEVVIQEKFSASRFWDICSDHGVTAVHYLGTLPMMLWNQEPASGQEDNSVRVAYGAGMPEEIQEGFGQRFGLEIFELYGSTEQGVVAMSRRGSLKTGTCGRPVADVEMQIHDPDGNQCSANVVGEIVVRNREPGIFFDGYHGMPDATIEAWRDLWFRTGDAGSIDEDGYLTFTGRLTDSIRRRGENVSAWEVERVLTEHTDVDEVAVFGVPSELGEEEVMAIVVGDSVDLQELWQYAAGKLPGFAVPRYMRVQDELPKTPTGRVQKHQLTGVDGETSEWERRLTR